MNYRICFAAYLRRLGRSPQTIKKHSYALAEFRSFCRNRPGRKSMAGLLRSGRVEEYRDYLLEEQKLRPSTVNGRLSSLSVFARFLIEHNLLPFNPLDLVERIRENKLPARPPALYTQVQALRREVHSDILNLRDRAVVELLCTGLSVGELCTLYWDGQTHTSQSLNLTIRRRRIDLHPEAEEALRHYLILRPILAGPFLIVGDLSSNYFLTPATVYGIVRRLAKKVGATIRVRDLRTCRLAQLQPSSEPAVMVA